MIEVTRKQTETEDEVTIKIPALLAEGLAEVIIGLNQMDYYEFGREIGDLWNELVDVLGHESVDNYQSSLVEYDQHNHRIKFKEQ